MVKAFACVKGLALALLLTAAGGVPALAKPPDLPVEAEYICLPSALSCPGQTEPPIVDTQGREYFIEVQSDNPVRYHCVPTGNGYNCVELIKWFWEDVVSVLNGACPACPPVCDVGSGLPMAAADAAGFVDLVQQLGEARKLYEQAEKHFQIGDLPAAHHFYQETHLKSPNSRYGQIARERLNQIELVMTQAVNAIQQAQVAQCNHGAGCPAAPVCTRTPTDGERFLKNLAQAQEMYHFAECCRRRGDLDKAYTCYHEAQRFCPTSEYAELANTEIRRIEALRQIRDDSEVTEEQTPDQSGSLDIQQLTPIALPVIMELLGFSAFDAPEEQPLRCRPYKPTARGTRCLESATFSSCYRLRPLAATVEEETPAEESSFEDVDLSSVDLDVDVSQLLTSVLGVLGGNPQVEIDFDTSREGNVRFLGGVYFGAVGCRVTVDGDNVSVTWPTFRGGMR